jgi:hypothetical protein
MSGFLSAYEGTYRITIPHPDREYWVELRKHLQHGATEKSAAALQSVSVVDGKPQMRPDVWRSRTEMVCASIVNWNLDDPNGTVWPINIQSVRRLPEAVFDQIHDAIEESNKPLTPAERAQFPDEGSGGDQDGLGGAGEPVDVPDGAGTVAATWSEA